MADHELGSAYYALKSVAPASEPQADQHPGRRRRGRDITLAAIGRALDGHGVLFRTADGRRQPATPTPAFLQDVAIVALVRAEQAQPIPYGRLREILTAVGLKPPTSGGGPVMQYHPLVYSVSYGWWALRDQPTLVAG